MAQSTIVGQENSRVKSASSSHTEPSPASTQSAQSVSPPSKRAGKKTRGLTFERRFSTAGPDPLGDMTWEGRTSVITSSDGSVVFKMDGAEIPAGWSQLATDIVVSKYFRKAGLHGDKAQGETSVRQVVHRIAHTIRVAGETAGGYFASKKDADTFEAELVWMLANQYGAFNSPVWFNCGLFHEYGIEGSGSNWAWSEKAQKCEETANAYSRPKE